MNPLTSAARINTQGGKNMKHRLLVLAAALGLSANVVAQDFYGIYRDTSDNGDLRELGQEDDYSPGQPRPCLMESWVLPVRLRSAGIRIPTRIRGFGLPQRIPISSTRLTGLTQAGLVTRPCCLARRVITL